MGLGMEEDKIAMGEGEVAIRVSGEPNGAPMGESGAPFFAAMVVCHRKTKQSLDLGF